jgi:putative restriction endonuclease
MPVDSSLVKMGTEYSRHELARLWGYKSFHALARGVVTPAGDSKIILFVTKHKQESAEQYRNELNGSELKWEGPTDHFAEQRMLDAKHGEDQIHVFYRERHHTDFTYLGQASVGDTTIRVDAPSSFTLNF